MEKRENKLKMMILAALFAALTAIGAFLQIPLGFTSITLQTFFTAMAAILLGAKWGTISQLVYVLLGIAGLPIFTQGGGLGYFLKPSMGFLIGLIPMALALGLMTQNLSRKQNWFPRLIAALVVGEIVLYLIGTPYMGAILNLYMGKDYSAWEIFRIGCLIYLPGDLVKLLAVALLYAPLTKALHSAKIL